MTVAKNFVIVAFVSFTASCAPAGTKTDSNTQEIQQVQNLAKQYCRFEPDVAPIVELIPMFGGVAKNVADAICNAVNTTPQVAAPGATMTVMVRDVTVSGVKVQ